jgi:pimeloyl-ACP methyl ester carboxylesterase
MTAAHFDLHASRQTSPWTVGLRSQLGRMLQPASLNREQTLRRTESISALTHLLSSLEHLARPSYRRTGGLNNWNITRDGTLLKSRRVLRVVDAAARPAVTATLHVARCGAALALVAPRGGRRVRGVANATLATTSILLHPRHHYGTDGADQVSTLVQGLAAIGRAGDRRPRVVDAALWTVALQATMSYAVSGWVKLAGTTWREGRALPGITRTVTYGDAKMWRALGRHPRLSKAMEATVLGLECSTPLAYIAGGRLAKTYVLALTGMHVGIARIMGLGRFVPSFCSMHPAMLYTSARRSTHLHELRHDTTVRWFAVGAVGLLGAATAHRQLNSSRTSRGWGDELTLSASDGNTIVYRRRGIDHHGPVIILENGLLSTPEHWEWIVNELIIDGTVVTYQRAGYGASTAHAATGLDIDDLVAVSVDLIDRTANGRPVVLVGHSLGGYLAMLAAARSTTHVAAVILVDSAHPDELRRSERQRLGAERLRHGINTIGNSLRCGSSMLLDVPPWVRSLPPHVQSSALAQYRNHRMWRAALREWDATVRGFQRHRTMPGLVCPVLTLSAAKTIDTDPVQAELHQELAECGSWGRRLTIEHADHDSILTNRQHAQRAAQLMREFLADVNSSDSMTSPNRSAAVAP